MVLKCYNVSKNSLESGLEMLQALTQYSLMWSRSVTVFYTIPQKVVSKCHRFPHTLSQKWSGILINPLMIT